MWGYHLNPQPKGSLMRALSSVLTSGLIIAALAASPAASVSLPHTRGGATPALNCWIFESWCS